MKIKSIVITSFLIILLAHGAYTTLVPILLLNILTLLFVVYIIYKKFVSNPNRDYWGFVLCIYICSHFNFLNKYGGLFVIATFLIGVLLIINKKRLGEFELNDTLIFFILVLFVVFNFAGIIIKNKQNLFIIFNSVVAFMGYLIIFLISKSLIITKQKVIAIAMLFAFMAFYEMLVGLNTYLGIVKTGLTAFFPTDSRFGSKFSEATFNHSELFGEFAMLTILFLIPYVIARNLLSKNESRWVLFGIVCSVINIFLSGSRSVFGLLIIGILFSFFISAKSNIKLGIKRIISVGFAVLIILFLLWEPMDLGYLLDRFNDAKNPVNASNLLEANWITGKGTPREGAFRYFFERYSKDSHWIVGYGWGVPESNHIAWFGSTSIMRADYHSLYLSIIVLYGWVGAIAYILLFIITLYRLINALKITKRNKYLNYAAYPLIGFIMLISFLLLNEYKVSLLRISGYHMMSWIWLGLANAVYYTIINYEKNQNLLGSTLSR